MVRSPKGTIVLGSGGVLYLDDDRVEGEDLLTLFGERAADHLRRLDGFPHVGDLLINSTYDPELGEVTAFEEMVGSHGGMGGPQTQPFLLHPTELTVDDDPLVGAPAVHGQLRRWTDGLGVDEAGPMTTKPGVPEELPEPRALLLIAAWEAIVGILLLLAGLAVLAADLNGQASDLSVELGSAPFVVAVMLLGVGAGLGIWRRKRWAWMLTRALQGFNVL